MTIDKQQLIDFEKKIAGLYDDGELPYLCHFCGGNEDQLIEIFKEIRPGDYVFSTHRNTYHALLHGITPEILEAKIMAGKSMFVFDRKLNFYSSSIVCATPSIAAGVAWALKKKNSDKRVWCFIGDGAEDEGHFYEAVRYVDGWGLPCTFIIEDNDRSVSASVEERHGTSYRVRWTTPTPCVKRYCYTPTYPHGGNGSGKWVQFKKEAVVEKVPENKAYKLPEAKPLDQPMKYIDAVKKSMQMLAEDNRTCFIGYNVRHGSAYGTLKDIPESQKLETPLAENLMAGLAMGMSLEGLKPVLYFERHDFIYNALDALVNQLNKIEQLSQGEYIFPIIIRAVAGGVKPFYAGLTHTADLTELFKSIFSFPVYAPETSAEVIKAYEIAMASEGPVLISERKDLYET